MTIELEFICELCGCSVADGEGCLYVPFAEIRRHHQEAESNADRYAGLGVIVIPDYAWWHITHTGCRPIHADLFEIAVEQVRTWRDLVRWTAHLMNKGWLAATDWRYLLGDAVEGKDHRLIPAEVRGDAA